MKSNNNIFFLLNYILIYKLPNHIGRGYVIDGSRIEVPCRLKNIITKKC